MKTLLRVALYYALISTTISQNKKNTTFLNNNDLFITHKERLALAKFKEYVLPFLHIRYMRQNIFLIRWLRASNFNIAQADRMLRRSIWWRRENKMEEILFEDFSDLPNFEIDTYDKNGAPVIIVAAEQWNLRRIFLNGKAKRLKRLAFKVVEDACAKVRHAQLSGKNVTRFHILLNLRGFNLHKHGCAQCLASMIRAIREYESNYPGMVDRIVIFNSVPMSRALRPILNGALSGITRTRITCFGGNKNEWQRYLLKFIDPSQLRPDLGGTRKDRLKFKSQY